MKWLTVIPLLCFIASIAQNRDTTYFNNYGEETGSQAGIYYRVGKKSLQGFYYDSVRSLYKKSNTIRSREFYDRFGNPKGHYKTFYSHGRLRSTGRYEKKKFTAIDPASDSIEALILEFYDSLGRAQVVEGEGHIRGRIEGLIESGKINNGFKDSVWTTFHESGRIYAHESWQQGNFIDGISYDAEGKEFYYKDLLTLPEPDGGMTIFFEHLSDLITYPKEAEKRGIEGKITIEFIVQRDGTIGSTRILKGIGFGCDEEAVRVLKTSPPWKPSRRKGQPSPYKMTIPFLFKLT